MDVKCWNIKEDDTQKIGDMFIKDEIETRYQNDEFQPEFVHVDAIEPEVIIKTEDKEISVDTNISFECDVKEELLDIPDEDIAFKEGKMVHLEDKGCEVFNFNSNTEQIFQTYEEKISNSGSPKELSAEKNDESQLFGDVDVDKCEESFNDEVTVSPHKKCKCAEFEICNCKKNQVESYKCTECEYSCSLKRILSSHFREVHKKIYKPIECPECGRQFCKYNQLAKHNRLVHLKERPHKCSECDISFGYKRSLTNHVNSVHRNEKAFKCSECGNCFLSKVHLKNHLLSIHTKIKPYICTECDSGFGQKIHLTKHILTVHEKVKPFKCNDCETYFGNKSSLTYHIMSFHKKEKPFKCKECDYSCSVISSLNKHVRIVHRNEKPFQCSECDRSFSSRYNLSEHMRSMHSTLRPYTCPECDYAAKQKGSLKKHIRVMHDKMKHFMCS